MTSRTKMAEQEPLLHSFFVSGQVIGDDRGEARIRKFVEQKIAARQEAHFARAREQRILERERCWKWAACVEAFMLLLGFVMWCFRG